MTPNLHFRSLNSSIVLEASRLLSTETAATSNMPKQLLISGVSSFGFSGTNAHVVLACEKSAMVLVQTGQVVQVCYSQAAFGWWDDACFTVATRDLLGVSLTNTVSDSDSSAEWERVWPVQCCQYLADHRVGHTSLVPGTGYISIAREAASTRQTGVAIISKAQFTSMLFLDDNAPIVRVRMLQPEEAATTICIESGATNNMVLHATFSVKFTSHRQSNPAQSIHRFHAVALQTDHSLSVEAPSAVYVELAEAASQTGSYISEYPYWLKGGALGPSVLAIPLWCGQLEVMRTQCHMYTTTWTEFTPSGDKIQSTTHGITVWSSGGTARSNQHSLDTFGQHLIGATSVDEVCAGRPTVLIAIGCLRSFLALSNILRAIQSAVCSAASVWMVSYGSGSAGWGMAQSVNAEMINAVRCLCVDGPVHHALALVQTDESLLLASASGRIKQARLANLGKAIVGRPMQLRISDQGTLSSLNIQLQPARSSFTVQSGFMLQVKAVGLNFRDVLNCLGMYPGEPGEPGDDCAGVTHTYQEESLAPQVFGLAAGCLRTYASADWRLFAPIPDDWAFGEAAAIPSTWMTAFASLEELSGMRSNTRILLQAATGGVGLVAVHFAQRAGGELCATAGRIEKQDYLRRLQVNLVSTTRDGTTFAGELRGMLGLDTRLSMVLNSLSHDEYIQRASVLMEEKGHFVEIGKRGILSRSDMAAKQQIRYVVISLDGQCSQDPLKLQQSLQMLSCRMSLNCEVRTLPLHTFDFRRDIVEAFRLLQRAKQIGKVVLSLHPNGRCARYPSDSLELIVTGGTGGLGLLISHWLLQRTNHLVLLSRSGVCANGTQSQWQRLSGPSEAENTVQVKLCDVGDAQEIQQAFEHDFGGVVHAAGVLMDGILQNQTQYGLKRVWEPKAHSAWSLHQVCQGAKEAQNQIFVLFSSIATVLGFPGQANYAAANAGLDELSRLRRQHGLPGTAMQWGGWAGAGMAAESGLLKLAARNYGLGAVTDASGLCALELAWAGSCPVVAMVPLRWAVVLARFEDQIPTFLEGFKSHRQCRVQESQIAESCTSGFMASVTGKDSEAVKEALERLVIEKVEEVAGVVVSREDALMESGVDSLAATEFQICLQNELGGAGKLSSTIMFDHPTVHAIVEFILSQSAPPTARVICRSTPVKSLESQYDTIGVTGMSSVLPLQWIGLDNSPLWASRCVATDSTQSIPTTRFTLDAAAMGVPPELLYTKQGHFIRNAELFEPTAFAMSPLEVISTDPSHRVLLTTVFRTTTQANVSKALLRGAAVGVFLGFANVIDWPMVCQQKQQKASTVNTFTAHGMDGAAAAGRISYLFGLKGPCFSVNTACSSSLVALDSASMALGQKTCKAGLVAGVSLQLHPSAWPAFCAMHALAFDGRCKTFDILANGYARSEACGAVLLERKASDINLLSTAVNQDGRSASFMAPNGPSQDAVIEAAMWSCVGPFLAHSTEAHGTGTALGDPIEVGALSRVFERMPKLEWLSVGALKSQMAHAEGASGIAGVVKAMLVLQHCTVLPNLHLCESNPKLDLNCFQIVMSSQLSTAVLSREATDFCTQGISSFGYSGTNSHSILNSVLCTSELLSKRPTICYRQTSFSWWERAGSSCPFLGPCSIAADTSKTWEQKWPDQTCSYLVNHRVGCTPLAPGTCFLHLARIAMADALTQGVRVTDATFASMLLIRQFAAGPTLRVTHDAGVSEVRIESTMDSGLGAAWVLHASMTGVAAAGVSEDIHRPSAMQSTKCWLDGATFYNVNGNDYRGTFRGVESIWLSSCCIVSKASSEHSSNKVLTGSRVAVLKCVLLRRDS